MDIKEAYKVMQEASGIKKGDKVRALRHFENDEMGSSVWPSRGHDQRKAFVDEKKVGLVTCVNNKSFEVTESSGFCWLCPFFVLEVVEPANTIELRYFKDSKDITSELSDESKRNLRKL